MNKRPKLNLYLGDCVEQLHNLVSGSVDLTVTSPPYDNIRKYKTGPEFDFEKIANELYRVTKVGGVVVWIVGDQTVNGSETGTSFRQALYFKEIGFNLHDTMIWNKELFTATGSLISRYAPVFEYMFVLSKGKPKTFNPIKDHKNKHAGTKVHGTIRTSDGSIRVMTGHNKKVIADFGHRHNIWNISPVRRNLYNHPAPFPEALANDHIISWSNPGDTVLDPFMGSGTTGKMAILSGRNFIGIEKESEYMEIAKTRIDNAVRSLETASDCEPKQLPLL